MSRSKGFYIADDVTRSVSGRLIVADRGLHPLRSLVDQRVPQPGPRAPLADMLGRNPRLRQPTIAEQLAQPARVLAIGLGTALATAQRARLHRLGEMWPRARLDQGVTDEQPACGRLHRDIDLAAAE